MNILFLDTETTGLKAEDRLIQVAYKLHKPDAIFGSKDDATPPEMKYYLPPLPIGFDAMSVHHITNEMVAGCGRFQDSEEKKYFETLLPNTILVAHNAPFDVEMLAREGLLFVNWIDTLRVACHLIDSPSHKLQYLRYSLALNVEGVAHDAAGDVNVLVCLFDYLFNLIKTTDGLEDQRIIDKMQTLSTMPVLLKKFNFGKHAGKLFEEVAKIDRGYLSWLYGQEMAKLEPERNHDLVYTVKAHLNPTEGNPSQTQIL